MRHRDRGVSTLAVEQQRQRQADERRATDHDGAGTRGGHFIFLKQPHHAERRAADQTWTIAQERPIERSVRPSTSFSGGMRSSTGSGRGRQAVEAAPARRAQTDLQSTPEPPLRPPLSCGHPAGRRGARRSRPRGPSCACSHVALRWSVVADEHRCQADPGRPSASTVTRRPADDLITQRISVHQDRSHAVKLLPSKIGPRATFNQLSRSDPGSEPTGSNQPASEWVTGCSPIHSRRVFLSLVC